MEISWYLIIEFGPRSLCFSYPETIASQLNSNEWNTKFQRKMSIKYVLTDAYDLDFVPTITWFFPEMLLFKIEKVEKQFILLSTLSATSSNK